MLKPELNIKYYREKAEMSQTQLAMLLNISQSYISELESNLKLPSLKMLYRIAEALNICPRLLLRCKMKVRKYNLIKF